MENGKLLGSTIAFFISIVLVLVMFPMLADYDSEKDAMKHYNYAAVVNGDIVEAKKCKTNGETKVCDVLNEVLLMNEEDKVVEDYWMK